MGDPASAGRTDKDIVATKADQRVVADVAYQKIVAVIAGKEIVEVRAAQALNVDQDIAAAKAVIAHHAVDEAGGYA